MSLLQIVYNTEYWWSNEEHKESYEDASLKIAVQIDEKWSPASLRQCLKMKFMFPGENKWNQIFFWYLLRNIVLIDSDCSTSLIGLRSEIWRLVWEVYRGEFRGLDHFECLLWFHVSKWDRVCERFSHPPNYTITQLTPLYACHRFVVDTTRPNKILDCLLLRGWTKLV